MRSAGPRHPVLALYAGPSRLPKAILTHMLAAARRELFQGDDAAGLNASTSSWMGPALRRPGNR